MSEELDQRKWGTLCSMKQAKKLEVQELTKKLRNAECELAVLDATYNDNKDRITELAFGPQSEETNAPPES